MTSRSFRGAIVLIALALVSCAPAAKPRPVPLEELDQEVETGQFVGPEINWPDGSSVRFTDIHERVEGVELDFYSFSLPVHHGYAVGTMSCDNFAVLAFRTEDEWGFDGIIFASEGIPSIHLPRKNGDLVAVGTMNPALLRRDGQSWELLQPTYDEPIRLGDSTQTDFRVSGIAPTISHERVWLTGFFPDNPATAVIASHSMENSEPIQIHRAGSRILGVSDRGLVITDALTVTSPTSGHVELQNLDTDGVEPLLQIRPAAAEWKGEEFIVQRAVESDGSIAIVRSLEGGRSPQLILVTPDGARIFRLHSVAEVSLDPPWLAWADPIKGTENQRQFLYNIDTGKIYDLGEGRRTVGLPSVCGDDLLFTGFEDGDVITLAHLDTAN